MPPGDCRIRPRVVKMELKEMSRHRETTGVPFRAQRPVLWPLKTAVNRTSDSDAHFPQLTRNTLCSPTDLPPAKMESPQHTSP